MAWYSMKDIKIEGNYPLKVISDISMDIAVNGHGTLVYSGLVAKEDALRFVQQSSDKQVVKVFIKDELEFCGYPAEISTEYPNADADYNHCQLHIKLVTSSTFTDIYPKERFYQDTSRTFEEIIAEALEDSGTGNLVAIRGKKAIRDVILQYRETDWQFALRMAGRLGTVVVPNAISEEPEFSLGIPKREVLEEQNDVVRQMGRGISEFRAKYNESSKFSQQIRGFQGVSDFHNFLHYRMRSDNRYKLGDSVLVDGKTLSVMRKTFVHERGGIEEIYTFGHEQEFAVPFHHNRQIAGLELIGTVLERDGQRIKLLLDIDANRQAFEKTWFYYAPATNNGMYSMPLEGESVMLGWQSEIDHDALILRPVRKNGSSMPHNAEKHFLTEFDQHMLMMPGLIEYTNPVGSIKWLERMGFKISTDKDFVLLAGGDIVIKSNDQVEVRSPERITAGKTDIPSSIDMISNEIHIAANNVEQRSWVNDYKDANLPKSENSLVVKGRTFSGRAASVALVSNATNKQKGNFGEMHTDSDVEANGPVVENPPPAVHQTAKRVGEGRVTDIDQKMQKGIDAIYKCSPSPPPPEYLVVESKFGSSKLGMTKDGRQMSDTWITSSKEKRIEKYFGVAADTPADDPKMAEVRAFRESLKNGWVQKELSHIDSIGTVMRSIINDAGGNERNA